MLSPGRSASPDDDESPPPLPDVEEKALEALEALARMDARLGSPALAEPQDRINTDLEFLVSGAHYLICI